MTTRRSRPKTNPFDDDSTTTSSTAPHHDPRLSHYETLLSTQIDPDFFTQPQNFHALTRVIDILGVTLQNNSHKGFHHNQSSSLDIDPESYSDNHAYQNLQRQQGLVEEAIEHMAVRHCADLNYSVSAVGRMSRQFDEARERVGGLRVQVGSVGDSLRLGEVGGGLLQVCLWFFIVLLFCGRSGWFLLIVMLGWSELYVLCISCCFFRTIDCSICTIDSV